jgi:hypothetical protein
MQRKCLDQEKTISHQDQGEWLQQFNMVGCKLRPNFEVNFGYLIVFVSTPNDATY